MLRLRDASGMATVTLNVFLVLPMYEVARCLLNFVKVCPTTCCVAYLLPAGDLPASMTPSDSKATSTSVGTASILESALQTRTTETVTSQLDMAGSSPAPATALCNQS